MLWQLLRNFYWGQLVTYRDKATSFSFLAGWVLVPQKALAIGFLLQINSGQYSLDFFLLLLPASVGFVLSSVGFYLPDGLPEVRCSGCRLSISLWFTEWPLPVSSPMHWVPSLRASLGVFFQIFAACLAGRPRCLAHMFLGQLDLNTTANGQMRGGVKAGSRNS